MAEAKSVVAVYQHTCATGFDPHVTTIRVGEGKTSLDYPGPRRNRQMRTGRFQPREWTRIMAAGLRQHPEPGDDESPDVLLDL